MKVTSLGPFSVTEKRTVTEKKKSETLTPTPPPEVATDTSVDDDPASQPRLGKVLDLIEEAKKRADNKKNNLNHKKKKAIHRFLKIAKKEDEKDYRGISVNKKV